MREADILGSNLFLSDSDMSKYEGMWVAVVDKKIVAADKSVKKAYNIAKKVYSAEEILLEKVFGKTTLIV